MIRIINQKVAPFAIELLLEEPFYGYWLSGLLKYPKEVDDIALGVEDQQLVLYFDEKWLETDLNWKQRRGRIKHELLHLVFRHPLQRVEPGRSVLHHIATDLVVNQYLEEEELEPEAITLEAFGSLDLKPGESWKDYYAVLVQAWGTRKRKMRPTDDAGWEEIVNSCLSGQHPAVRRHRWWPGEDVFLSGPVRALFDVQITELMRQIRGQLGREAMAGLPVSVQVLLQQSERKAQIDWRRVVRLFVASSRKTRLKNTIRRPSKRYGTTPGIQIVRTGRLLVAVDTSASVTEEVLTVFFEEIHHLWRLGNELVIVECDTTIQRKYEYRGDRPDHAHGRGGTQYEAPIRWANESFRPDGILYFTDGLGPPPVVRNHAPLLWVIVGEGGVHLPGRQLRLEAGVLNNEGKFQWQ